MRFFLFISLVVLLLSSCYSVRVNKFFDEQILIENEFYEREKAYIINNYAPSDTAAALDSLRIAHDDNINYFNEERKRLKKVKRKDRDSLSLETYINQHMLNKVSEDTTVVAEELQIEISNSIRIESNHQIRDFKPKNKIPIKNAKITDKANADSTSSKGTIAYSVPDEMTVGEKYKITVRISKKKGTEIKKTLILGEQEIAISDTSVNSKIFLENIRVENSMTVQLLSQPGAFEISPTSTETQVLEDESYTEWSWVVKPLSSGTNYLKMIIKIKVQSGSETSYKDIVVFDKNIRVKSNVKFEVKSWLSQYWQWLMTTIIIPLVVFLYKNRKKKEEN